MAIYIYASLPKSYGSFQQIQEDNYPFNRIFHNYIRRIVTIGVNNDLDIFSLIGYIEHGLSGDERLPDTPEGDKAVRFRFSIEDEMIENYYREQELSNKVITQMIVRMTIRLAGKYGTSLTRLATMIDQIDEPLVNYDSKTSPRATEEKAPEETPAKTKKQKRMKKQRPSIRITEKEEAVVEKEEAVAEKAEAVAETEKLKAKLEELQRKQDQLTNDEDEADDNDDNEGDEGNVVLTNPHLSEFFG